MRIAKRLPKFYNRQVMYIYYKKYVPYLFILPAAVVLVLFFFIPFFETVVLSFKDYSTDLYSPGFIGLKNYTDLLSSKEFYKVLWNTFLYLIGAVPVLATVPLVLAILINQKIRCINLYKVLIYLPVIVSIVVVAIAFKWLYASSGILNYFLELLNLSKVEWLTSPDYPVHIQPRRQAAEHQGAFQAVRREHLSREECI